MKKILSFAPILCLILVAIFCFSACSIGVCTITFETFDALYTPQEQHFSPGDSVTSLPSMSKIGFRHVGWSDSEDLSTTLYTPFTIHESFTAYVKYEIDPTYFYNDRIIQWDNLNSFARTETDVNSSTVLFLINKTNTTSPLTQITVNAYSSDFTCSGLKLYDKYGKPLSDTDSSVSTFRLPTGLSNTSTEQFVLEIKASTTGKVAIMVS